MGEWICFSNSQWEWMGSALPAVLTPAPWSRLQSKKPRGPWTHILVSGTEEGGLTSVWGLSALEQLLTSLLLLLDHLGKGKSWQVWTGSQPVPLPQLCPRWSPSSWSCGNQVFSVKGVNVKLSLEANIPELLPTCFVKCCLTLQGSLVKERAVYHQMS
jgi:hypothetical protein